MFEKLDNRIVDIKRNINGKNDDPIKTVDLIANSGIQFIDYEFDKEIHFDENDKTDPFYVPKYIAKGQFDFLEKTHFVRQDEDNYEEGAEGSVNMIESLNLYNGVWFPIPYFCKNMNAQSKDKGPTNWARARIINLSDLYSRETSGKFHVTLAFDTKIDSENKALHCAPAPSDINDKFTFRAGQEAAELLIKGIDGNSYVSSWAKDVCQKIYPKMLSSRKQKTFQEDWIDSNEFEKHYLNVIAFIEYFVQPNDIQLIPFDASASTKPIDVSLVLDIGNSRSCGILVEEDESNPNSLIGNPQLEIRDLNAVENLYKGTFDSVIQFQKANFDFNYCSDISSRLDAFSWPSIVRVGTESRKLSSMVNGTDGRTGLTSPKRLLWQLEASTNSDEWKSNNAYYQIPVRVKDMDDNFTEEYFREEDDSKSAYYRPISDYINSSGDARFADTGDEAKMQADFSGKSSMTFMLMEVFMQAMLQMNSFHYRHTKPSSKSPRKLKSVVLTFPPSIPDLEREVFRSCAYQAIGLIWKTYGYDTSPVYEFKYRDNAKKMFPAPPEVSLNWNETLAGQLVYIYNETQNVFQGNTLDFIKNIRRTDADGRINEVNPAYFGRDRAIYESARIATIDIGGGTTDLVIADYSYPSKLISQNDENEVRDLGNQTGVLQVREILKEGYKIAGDDLVYELIRKQVLVMLQKAGIPEDALKRIIGNPTGTTDIKVTKTRVQVVDQIFTAIAYRLITRLEQLYKAPIDEIDIKAEGTIRDFIFGTDSCRVLDTEEDIARVSKFKEENKESAVDKNVEKFIDDNFTMKCYEFLNTHLEFDIYKINRDIAFENKYDLCNSLNFLNGIVNAYACDVLILTGRPSKIPGIRYLIESKSFLSHKRIVCLHEYDVGNNWYPAFSLDEGKVGDPKTAVVVGALLGFIKQLNPNNLVNFRIDPKYQDASSSVRNMGKINNDNMLDNEEIYFKFITKAEKNIIQNNLKGEQLFQELSKPNANNASLRKDADVREIISNIPANFGYRQFNDDKLSGSMLYTLEAYKDSSDLALVRDTKNWILPPMSNISFTNEYKEALNSKRDNVNGILSKLTSIYTETDSGETKSYQDIGNEIFDKYAAKMSVCQSNADSAKDMNLIENVDSSSPFYDVVQGFLNSAARAADSVAEEKQPKGFFAKFTNQASKLESKKAEAIASFKQANLPNLSAQIDILIQREKTKITQEFVRDLSKCINSAIQERRLKYTEILENVNKAIRDQRVFNLKFSYGEVSEKEDTAVGKCISFVYDQEKEDIPNLYLLKLESAVEKSKGESQTDDDIKDYLRLCLKTTSGSDEYWNNNGLLL